VDEEALYEALKSRRIAGAGLDTFRREPPIRSPLLTLDNVVLSPHSLGNSLKAQTMMGERCLKAIMAVARGGSPEPEYVLNPGALK
jgi:D-3-phosphoglycerate dehydrogenase